MPRNLNDINYIKLRSLNVCDKIQTNAEIEEIEAPQNTEKFSKL